MFGNRKHKAVELYSMKRVSLGLWAKLAGLSLSEFIDAKILDKPHTLVCGESWTSENPNKLRTSVRSGTQGFSDLLKEHNIYLNAR